MNKIAPLSRYSNISALRYIAAVGVILFHGMGNFQARGGDVGMMMKIFNAGAMGVDVFFVISGFVIFLAVQNGNCTSAQFIKSRCKRIFPSYWILTAAAVVVSFVSNVLGRSASLAEPTFTFVLQSLTFTSHMFGNEHPVLYQGWTLEYEMLFYVFVFLGLSLFKNRLHVFALAALFIIAGVFVFDLSFQLLEFLAGIVVGVIVKYKFIAPRFGLLSIYLGSACLVWALSAEAEVQKSVLQVLGSFSIVLGCVLAPQLKFRLIELFGKISYPSYLIQWFTISFLAAAVSTVDTQVSAALFLTACVAFTSLLGFFFDTYIDSPIKKKMTKWGW